MQTQEKADVPRWITYRDAAEYSSLGRTTLTELVTSGRVRAAKVGKAVRIDRQGLDEFMEASSYSEVS